MPRAAVYAILGIISSVNQHIIDTTSNQLLPRISAVASFPWSLCVSTLKDLEAVVEVAAQHFYGEEGKWNFIALAEATKYDGSSRTFTLFFFLLRC